MVDLGGYVIILVETKDKKIKLYGSPADKDNLEVGDEIMEVNGKTLEDATHTEVISHIHQCIRSRTICLRVKRRSAPRLALDLELCASNVQDAFVIAVEQQARERLERLSALKRIKPVDMTKLSQQLNQQSTTSTPSRGGGPHSTQDNNSFIENSPIYVTSLSTTEPVNNNVTTSVTTLSTDQQQNVAAVTNSNYRKTSPLVSSSNDKGGSSSKPNGHIGNARETTDLILNQDLIGGGDANNRSVSVISAGSSGGQAADAILPPVSPSNVNSERRASSPFINGRTEVLIGADENKFKTTALVETNNRLGIDTENRPRRRSGSSIVVLDGEAEPVKRPPDEVGDSYDTSSGFNMVMMLAGENGPHREMAVDVPDSFVGRNKTPPRYPPPKPRPQATVNDNNTAKPVPPPRDHLRIEKDGRLVNRAPAPQVPTRIANNNYVVNSSNKEPTKEQLESIRKFQEQLRKRREEEERLAQQTEFLNSSLRGSRKLQALESTPQPHGLVNDAYSSTEENEEEGEPVIVHQTISYGNLVASLQRLQLQTKKYPAASNLEGQIAAVQSLLLSPEFGRAIAVHNAVQEARTNFASTTGVSAAPENNAQIIVRDCLDSLGSCSSAAATELADLLTGYEMEGLMSAHDSIVDMLDSESIFLQEKIVKSNALEDNTRTNDSVSEQYTDNSIKIIKIEKTNEPLGATVLNQGDAVIIGRIVRGGAADKSGLLHEGDEVLEVNGVEMRGKSVNAVCDILASMQGTLTFLVVPAANARTNSQRDTVLHVKAHFDYDPEDDVLIPCRELGISFQKGDVLHIISQEDPNWWQAYREGEEDQTLAGLVPSMSFQHQRETMKRSAIGDDKGLREKPQKTGTLLCARKTPKKKKKKGPYNEGGYPLYTTTVDEYDMEEILTYEEVALYYPRANHKRPIVLIGPPNIGRHELRQRLMEDSERFAAAIPHTSRARKDSEIDGQDYHFITRAQFEADIVARKFVEHGEYEKAYYGTSLDAIRSVVNSGKICVLNLHPQSLRILRTSDLKPYIVFVAPPSLEKLRQKKIRNGEAFKEEELKDIIEKAREMEDKYGHFFDMIIINNDTERAYHQLLSEINSLEREPQWVPAAWVKAM